MKSNIRWSHLHLLKTNMASMAPPSLSTFFRHCRSTSVFQLILEGVPKKQIWSPPSYTSNRWLIRHMKARSLISLTKCLRIHERIPPPTAKLFSSSTLPSARNHRHFAKHSNSKFKKRKMKQQITNLLQPTHKNLTSCQMLFQKQISVYITTEYRQNAP